MSKTMMGFWVGIAFVCMVSNVQAVGADWGDTAWPGSKVYGADDTTDVSKTTAVAGTGWLYQLVVDKGTTTDFATIAGLSSWNGISNGADTDEVVGEGHLLLVADVEPAVSGSSDGTGYEGLSYYVRFFDSETGGFGTGGNVGIMYDDGSGIAAEEWVYLADPFDSPNADFTPGQYSFVKGTGTHNDGWSTTIAAVPEPGTMTLFALGMLTLAARMRRRKR